MLYMLKFDSDMTDELIAIHDHNIQLSADFLPQVRLIFHWARISRNSAQELTDLTTNEMGRAGIDNWCPRLRRWAKVRKFDSNNE